MSIPSETIALPLVKGVDLQTDARLVAPPSLLEALNTQFAGGGAKKRKGHVATLVKDEDPLELSYAFPGGSVIIAPGLISPTWHYGVGVGQEFRVPGQESVRNWNNLQPEVGKLCGVFSRDNENVAWDGFRFFSYNPSQSAAVSPYFSKVSGEACIPSLKAIPIAKYSEKQAYPEFADNGRTKITAWINGTQPRYVVYDSVSDALIAEGTLTGVSTADWVRCFTLGSWMHVMVHDLGNQKAILHSISADDPNTVNIRSYGDATHFDIWKVSDSEAVLVRTTAEAIFISWIGTLGMGSNSRVNFSYVPTVVTGARTHVAVGLGTQDIGVVWATSTQIGGATFDTTGSVKMEGSIWGLTNPVKRLTLSPKLAQLEAGIEPWDAFWDDGTDLFTRRFWRTSSNSSINLGTSIQRYKFKVCSRAWRVGDRTFLWAGFQSNVQSTWFLLDEQLLPVGKMNFGVADVSGLGSTSRVAGVNFKSGEDYDSNTPRFHSALNYKLRVAPDNSAQALSSIYTEPSPQAVYLDFLPKLRTAQAGRATYIAGAQLWSYDGREITEAGFHLGPEVTLSPSNGGALTALGTYSYRVDLCYRNAQNEEVRSLSILTSSLTLTGSQQTIALTIPSVITRRAKSYFLIYRNAMSSGVPLTNWWLLNSRDPNDATYLANDLTTPTFIYTDTGAVSDTAIQVRELHPATDTYLHPISAPACETIAGGRDRLWVAGGELPPGKVAPSRLFDPGEIPSFNAYLEVQIDRSDRPVTALGFVGEIGVIFKNNATYILDSDGPDNNASGTWNYPRLALADVGAVSQDSILRTSQGLVFQSPAGFRMVGAGGALSTIGLEIDSQIRDFTVVGSIISEKDQELRFYGSSTTWVFNYLYGTWAKWTCGGAGVAKNNDGKALIARSDGYLWVETDGVYLDGGSYYTHRIRTAWLHGGNLGDFQRVRRVGGLGRFADLTNPTHGLRLEIFYDEREFWEHRIEWTMPDAETNQDTWGAATWGAGVWGDTTATINNLKDRTWEWVRRPARQKCSAVSIALEDVDTNGPGFVLSAFTFELARKSGLNRTPARSGTGSYR